MKRFMPFVVLCFASASAFALTPAGQGRRSTANQMIDASRATASVNQLNAMAGLSGAAVKTSKSSVRVEPNDTGTTKPTEPTEEEKKDMREKEKAACTMNNIGIGNTFVWASRYSNINNYATMVEDVDTPENNTCFVKVELKSDDSKVNVSDVPAKYFEMGQTITCGAWANEDVLEKRILDAKKTARTWGTVGGAVGGAALGVGAMELFGNKLIGGAVEGQKALKGDELLYSQMKVLQKNEPAKFNQIISALRSLKTECDSDIWNGIDNKRPEECDRINYNYLLDLEAAL